MKSKPLKHASWHIAVLLLGAIAIALHFILKLSSLTLWGWPLELAPLFLVIIVGGIPLIGQIFLKLYRRDIGSDILAALSIITAFWLNEYLACVLVIMMLAGGQALEAFAIAKASSALGALIDRMPSQAVRKIGAIVETILLSEIRVGDTIVVAPHETCPVDGIVLEGHGDMDESYLSGEPYGVKKAPGSRTLSGAINGEHLLLVKTEKQPKDSRYAQIIQVMKEAEEKRPHLRRLADRLGAFFAPVSLLIAVSAWLYSGEAVRFLAVLVVATPCPLLIAIPVAIISTISMAAKRGIIIKDPSVLERLPTCTTAIFDKTGTLTFGQPHLIEIKEARGFEKNDVLQKVASLERYSKHPLAKAILDAAQKSGLLLLDAQSVAEKPGLGLIGNVLDEEVIISHRAALMRDFPEQAKHLPPSCLGLECIILINQVYAATMQFRDLPRAHGRSFIKHLAPFHAFNRVMLVSGDRESEVAYLASVLGIKETRASQSPEQKFELVKEETKNAPTLFMGDGINDAPALAAATVGIAFGNQTSVSAEAAGAVIMESSLHKVDELLHLSKRMRIIALESALGGIFLSFVAMGFAFFGGLSPVWGALLQQGIDALAIMNALRLALGTKVEIDLYH